MHIQKRLGTRKEAGDVNFWSYGAHKGTLKSTLGHSAELGFPYSWLCLKSSIGSGMNSFVPPIDPRGLSTPALSCCPAGMSLGPGLDDGGASLSWVRDLGKSRNHFVDACWDVATTGSTFCERVVVSRRHSERCHHPLGGANRYFPAARPTVVASQLRAVRLVDSRLKRTHHL